MIEYLPQLIYAGIATGVLLAFNKLVKLWNPPGDPTTDVGIKKISRFLLVSLYVLALMSIVGIPISSLSVILGGISAGVAFAARGFVANTFGAISLFMERPFSIGDKVSFCNSNISGTVISIETRATMLDTINGPCRVPNNSFAEQPYVITKRN